MVQKDNPEINWNKIYFFILFYNAVLVLLFFLMKLVFNIPAV